MTLQAEEVWNSPPKVGYDNHTGDHDCVPYRFYGLVTAFPEHVCGTWWYLHEDGTNGPVEGWYVWLESLGLIGVSRSDQISWRNADDLESGLARAATKLRTQ
jgi:hypothetical protein